MGLAHSEVRAMHCLAQETSTKPPFSTPAPLGGIHAIAIATRNQPWCRLLQLRRPMIRRCLLCLTLLAVVIPTQGLAEKKCGAATCGSPVKSQKTIGGVAHDCETTTCTKSCCTLSDPPVCSTEKTTSSSCAPAKTTPGTKLEKFKAPPATTKQR